ncbi:MAG: helicase-related protein [Gammaproteobacteria bacterium]|nr:helicase-related protein [Gammaproteobacteria bacterium]MDH5801954.1 helicase-related protein [Gammaproteobacteria bacterium]
MSNTLPIEQIKDRFTQALDLGHVVVQSPTGSGKSTHLPLWCMQKGRVLVIEPRRLACRSLARYVAQIHNSELGQSIGYAVRFDQQYGKNSQLVFVTPGIALRWFAQDKLIEFSCIILDEFHERRWDTDLLAALLKRHIQKNDMRRIVITSATVDGSRLAQYLDAQLLTSQGRTYPVDVRYSEQRDLPRLKHLENRITACLVELLAAQPEGDVLVFLPGKGEIQSVIATLGNNPDLKQQSIELIPLHAGVDSKTQDKALTPGKQRRIILATNVAETSLTIPGVRIVIDSGLERRTHHRNARTVLGLHQISQAAADQRSGRAGRTAPGLCVRLWGQQARLEPYTPPETSREELTELILAAAAGGNPVQQLQFPDPLPDHAVQRALDLLKDMQALNDTGLLTEHGKRLFPLPLDPLFSHLITAMPNNALRAAMIDLSAALSADRNLLPPLQQEHQHKSLKQWQPLNCDMCTLIAIMRNKVPENIPLNQKAVKEARQIATQTRNALQLGSDNPEFSRQELLAAIIQATPELVYIRRDKRRNALGNGFSEVEIGMESRFSEDDEAAVVLDQHHAPGKGTKKTINRATVMAPVTFQFLAKLNVGDKQYAQPQWMEHRVFTLQQRIYAGRIIHEELIEANGQTARDALADLIVQKRLRRRLSQTLQEDIDAWNLYIHLNDKTERPVDPRMWLSRRLQQLGVESGTDMELIEDHDLKFSGIPDWEREEFDRKYPRQVSLSNLTMTAEYEPRKKIVTLVKINGTRKTAPQQKELPLWGGWAIVFRDGSRVLQIKER